ncbi:hypothetical protein GUITHDRAFT_103027 [Guillardia theta CCMP2712]|uniref:Calx-beta domain-containing protein n=1 Tax=Guillardia theta (strain CCMP2712) TaxID=905079 RepID=L1JRM7_GUITC|nr:hypothetical protein GUITHDRAFT_103027 [Guillardia theta CCMP2712]EKX51107.1 hypothetical protein GUITHDRAFT_103027 [Guillardia theta CCMP2712]|eukprot:XP_005838087.1 hypothetical protein GUITHDRAFT_103027 [Guillardia theta CCMP2712]
MSCCNPANGGEAGVYFLPIFPMEYEWDRGFRAFLYLVGLLWSFLGVSVLSDVFMTGIERVTNSTRKVRRPKLDSNGRAILVDGQEQYEEVQVLIWNPAVANLTLMALGSSTPEILLSVIEICFSGFYSGELGPGTVVGSAAFNLFVITALCMLSIPKSETRKIDGFLSFCITTVFSVFAYLWVYISVMDNVVTVAEAVITFCMFPLLTLMVYMADNGLYSKMFYTIARIRPDELDDETPPPAPMTSTPLESFRSFSALQTSRSIIEDGGKLFLRQNQSRVKYRHLALQSLMGGKKITPEDLQAPELYIEKNLMEAEAESLLPVIQFESPNFSFLETVGIAKLVVTRQGNLSVEADVEYQTRDGTAKNSVHYEQTSGVLHFDPFETEQTILIRILHDLEWNEDLEFTTELSVVDSQLVKLGGMYQAVVTIIDMDGPGVFEWVEKEPQFFLSSDSAAYLQLQRMKGCTGDVKIRVRTVDDSAQAGQHFVGMDELVSFKDCQASKTVKIRLQNFDKPEDAGEDYMVRFFVKIQDMDDGSGIVISEYDTIEVRVEHREQADEDEEITWTQQFKQALSVNGGQDMADASATGLVLHYISITWKLVAAFIPPPSIWDGWATFCVALGMIGVVTTLINDLASIFGCIIGLEDPVTAITIVALGTSLPDTFASVLSIRADDNADNAVGNVTGSNSINVFLGLGLPWTIAAIYWHYTPPTARWLETYQGTPGNRPRMYPSVQNNNAFLPENGGNGGFVVAGGNLGFNTIYFTILTVIAISTLLLRRFVYGHELGGEGMINKVSAALFLLLWFAYIIVASLQTYYPSSFPAF